MHWIISIQSQTMCEVQHFESVSGVNLLWYATHSWLKICFAWGVTRILGPGKTCFIIIYQVHITVYFTHSIKWHFILIILKDKRYMHLPHENKGIIVKPNLYWNVKSSKLTLIPTLGMTFVEIVVVLPYWKLPYYIIRVCKPTLCYVCLWCS